jgi:hypothetical protein
VSCGPGESIIGEQSLWLALMVIGLIHPIPGKRKSKAVLRPQPSAVLYHASQWPGQKRWHEHDAAHPRSLKCY